MYVAGYLVSSFLCVFISSGFVNSAETWPQSPPGVYLRGVRASELQKARQMENGGTQQEPQHPSGLTPPEQKVQPRSASNQQTNGPIYPSSYVGSQQQQTVLNTQHYQQPLYNQHQQLNSQPPQAFQFQGSPQNQAQFPENRKEGNVVDRLSLENSTVDSASYPCLDINSVICQESIDANITHGIAVLAQNLSVSIFQTNYAYQEPTNTVFSPVNVATALALVLVGSEGETFAELSHVLGIASSLNLRPEARDVMYKEFGRFMGQLENRQTVTHITSRQATEGGNQVAFANGLFIEKDFCILERFKSVAKYFRSEVYNMDFSRKPQQSKDQINTWFDEKTRGRIKNMLVQAPSPDTKVLIASALYFNGEWETPFPSDITAVRQFFVTMRVVNGTYVDAYPVNLMTNGLTTRFFSDRELGCRMVELPYKGRNVSMYLILPDQPGVTALHDLERRLSPEHLLRMISMSEKKPVIVSLPRMKLSQTISLRSALEGLGVYTLFDPMSANLSLISDGKAPSADGECHKSESVPGGTRDGVLSSPAFQQSPAAAAPPPTAAKLPAGWKASQNPSPTRGNHPDFDRKNTMLLTRWNGPVNRLYAADILHKVDVEITETGTVAASGTATTISRDGSNQVMRLNRPFLFLIRDNPTNLTMFYGSVIRPTPATQAEIDEEGPMATAVPPTKRPAFNSKGKSH